MPVQPSDLVATLLARHGAARVRQLERAERLRRAARRTGGGLRAEGAIDGAWLVGSLAWGGFGAHSDVDVVVRGSDPRAVGALWVRFLEELGPDAEGRVDLLRLEDLPRSFRDRVLAEGWRLDEP